MVHGEHIYSLAYSPDGSRLISGGSIDDDGRREIRVWNAANGRLLRRIKAETENSSLVTYGFFGIDGKTIIGTVRGKTHFNTVNVQVWDAANGAAVRTINVERYSPYFYVSPDGKYIAHPDGSLSDVALYDSDTGKELEKIPFEASRELIAFSGDSGKLVLGSSSGAIKLFDTRTWNELCSIDGPESLSCVIVSYDGATIAAGYGDGYITLYDAKTGNELNSQKIANKGIYYMAYAPNGNEIFCGWDGFFTWGVVAVNTENLQKTWDTEILHTTCLAYSPDGKYIAVGISGDSYSEEKAVGRILIFDAKTKQEITQ